MGEAFLFSYCFSAEERCQVIGISESKAEQNARWMGWRWSSGRATIQSERDEGLGGAEAKGWVVAEELDWTWLWRSTPSAGWSEGDVEWWRTLKFPAWYEVNCVPQTETLKSSFLVPVSVTLFVNGVFADVIKTRSWGWALSQYGWCPY